MGKTIITKHTNIWFFEEFGLAFILTPGWSIYILLGFVGINIFIYKYRK
jgi:hypothetical protein